MDIKFNLAKILKIASVAIAAPRYMGAFGSAIGIDVLQQVGWLSMAEVYSGGAMALLEGFALAFVLSKWRLLKPCLQWYVLLLFICLLGATLPAVAVPYLLAEQNGLLISQLFEQMYWLQVAWSFLVAGVPMLVIMAVGFADTPDEQEQVVYQAKVKQAKFAEQAKIEQAKQNAEQSKQAGEQTKQQAEQDQASRLAEQAKLEQELSKPFACLGCGKRFNEQKGLNGHMAHCKAHANGKQQAEQAEAV